MDLEPRIPRGDPAARLSSRRSSLEMVHWTISFACGEPLLTHPPRQMTRLPLLRA
jgi:hypothetical protein